MKDLTTPEVIKHLQKRYPDAMSLESLAEGFPEASRRTLQRQLMRGVTDGLILKSGRARATRYQWIQTARRGAANPVLQLSKDDPIEWSRESLAAFAQLDKPLSQRKPVGYQIKLLEAYIPNQTFYLPEPQRSNLLSIGHSPLATGLPTNTPTMLSTLAKQVLDRLLIDLSWASSNLEGNTYSHLDTTQLIRHGTLAVGKGAVETQMILNHKAAIEYLVLTDVPRPLSRGTLYALHVFLSDGLIGDPMDGGRIRQTPVDIAGTSYRPMALPASLDALLGHVLATANAISHPLEQALFLLVHLPYLQPFIDVNKRVSRLATNIPLIAANLAPLSFINVPRHAYTQAVLSVYELLDVRPLAQIFAWGYERSCQDYNAYQQNQVTPDVFRLSHRQALMQAVCSKIRTGRYALPKSLSQEETEKFQQCVLRDLHSLSVVNGIRFGLTPLEVQSWLDKQARAQKRLAKPRL